MPETRNSLNRRALLRLAGSAAVSGMIGAPALARNAPAVETLAGTAFATDWRINLPAGAEGADSLADIRNLLDLVDRQMSPYRADSDITRLNLAGAGTVAAPAEMLEVTAAALDLAAASGGAFDPTVGPLVARWGFGPIQGDPRPGWSRFAVAGRAVDKVLPGATLDLCGIAKGYALDGLARVLDLAGHNSFLIDLGGEVLARGVHPSGRPWQVAVEDPRPAKEGIAEVLALSDLAVATSGDRENGFALGDRRYSHIIDPSTGEPVASAVASVSVIGPSAMWADGWATALMAAGAEAGPKLAREQGLAALFLLRDGAGLARVTTGAFDAHLA